MVSYGIRLISAGHGPTYTQAGTGTPSPTPANGGASAVCWPEHGTISLFHRNFQKGLSLPLHWMGEGYGAGLMQPACSSAWPAIGQGRSLGEQSREDSGLVFQGNRLDSIFFHSHLSFRGGLGARSMASAEAFSGTGHICPSWSRPKVADVCTLEQLLYMSRQELRTQYSRLFAPQMGHF